jgi:hypothetical protein
MKKLQLDALTVESFATTGAMATVRGTVAARENTGTGACPYSWDGTCWVTCWDSCYCETSVC